MGGDALRPDIEGYGTVAELHIAGGFLASQWVKDHDAAGGEIFWKPWTSEACDPRPVDPGKNFGFQVLYRIAITRSHGVACYACWLVRWVGRKLAPTATRRSLVTSRFDLISRRLCIAAVDPMHPSRAAAPNHRRLAQCRSVKEFILLNRDLRRPAWIVPVSLWLEATGYIYEAPPARGWDNMHYFFMI